MSIEQATSRAEAGDFDGAIQCINQQADAGQVMKAYHDLVLHMYWKKKNIAGVIAIATAGIAWMLHQPDDIAARKQAKILSYNLASFCWPGWDEPGIELGEREMQIGLRAAKQNYDLVHSLDLGPLPCARAAWMVAGFHLSMRDYRAAMGKYKQSADFAREANNDAECLLAQGFAILVNHLASQVINCTLTTLNPIKAQLHPLKDGEEFVRQIDTARAVCKRER